MTDIGFRTRCFRKSKRHDLLQGQWEDKRLAAHRQRIQNVAPRIDNDIPLSDSFMHVKVKPKKLQQEDERCLEVMMQNLILLRHLTEISSSKRVDDGDSVSSAVIAPGCLANSSIYKLPLRNQAYYDTIINMRRNQLEEMRQMVLARAAGLMNSDNEIANNIEINTTLEEEDAPSVDEVGSLSRRDRTQRPKTASNTSASGGRNNRRVSIMEKKESKGSGQHSTDSSEEMNGANMSDKHKKPHRLRARSASTRRNKRYE